MQRFAGEDLQVLAAFVSTPGAAEHKYSVPLLYSTQHTGGATHQHLSASAMQNFHASNNVNNVQAVQRRAAAGAADQRDWQTQRATHLAQQAAERADDAAAAARVSSMLRGCCLNTHMNI